MKTSPLAQLRQAQKVVEAEHAHIVATREHPVASQPGLAGGEILFESAVTLVAVERKIVALCLAIC